MCVCAVVLCLFISAVSLSATWSKFALHLSNLAAKHVRARDSEIKSKNVCVCVCALSYLAAKHMRARDSDIKSKNVCMCVCLCVCVCVCVCTVVLSSQTRACTGQ